MKHKNISLQSGRLLSYFVNEGNLSFDGKVAIKALPGSGDSAVRKLLSGIA